MAMKCYRCGGIIPDVMFGNSEDRLDCKNHKKQPLDIKEYLSEQADIRRDD
jgi:hypothetical protein